MAPLRRAAPGVVAVSLAAALLACPEERPGAAKEIPPQRVPPAMSLETPPSGPERVLAAPAPATATAAPSTAPAAPPSPATPPRRR